MQYDEHGAVDMPTESQDFAWLSDVYSLINRHQLEATADSMFEKIDDMLCAAELRRCNECMA